MLTPDHPEATVPGDVLSEAEVETFADRALIGRSSDPSTWVRAYSDDVSALIADRRALASRLEAAERENDRLKSFETVARGMVSDIRYCPEEMSLVAVEALFEPLLPDLWDDERREREMLLAEQEYEREERAR